MDTTADIVIVGGGANGTSTAFQLASLGARKVRLLERRHLGAGATGKSGALVRMHYGTLGWHPWATGPHPWAGRRGTDRARRLARALRSTFGAPG